MSAPLSRDRGRLASSRIGPSGGALPPMQDLPVWYDASPCWMVNLPQFLTAAATAGLIGFVSVLLSAYTPFWPFGFALMLIPVAIAANAAVDAAAMHVVIDPARVTVKTGIAVRRTASVELYRLVNVDAVTAWWQRPLGFGTLILETSDAYRPVWVLPGVRNVEFMREVLTRQTLELRIARGVREVNMGRL
ncbi:PH domain-containing protein [Burkholderia cepacia]|uniref:PH domain-containing protein n=1 Tax=Burkholderia cepacia TaxID=292 RepID=UPI00264C6005|nr:PH domain-containing protein [Burkholderia cepacia]MDN7900780.1 PH domain-containing protein [Burkholderia cepacia]